MVEINGGDVRRPWREEEAMARLRNSLAWVGPWDGRRRGWQTSWTCSRAPGSTVVVVTTTTVTSGGRAATTWTRASQGGESEG